MLFVAVKGTSLADTLIGPQMSNGIEASGFANLGLEAETTNNSGV